MRILLKLRSKSVALSTRMGALADPEIDPLILHHKPKHPPPRVYTTSSTDQLFPLQAPLQTRR